eukprot:scaffold223019_cov32-Tisochrysis_lutea.AAC.2
MPGAVGGSRALMGVSALLICIPLLLSLRLLPVATLLTDPRPVALSLSGRSCSTRSVLHNATKE